MNLPLKSGCEVVIEAKNFDSYQGIRAIRANFALSQGHLMLLGLVVNALKNTCEEYMEYPVNSFPPILLAAIQNVQLKTKAPIEIIAGSILGACSIACQGLIDVKRPFMQPSPVSLYLITVADSGERKSSVDRLFFDPVNRYDSELRDAFDVERKQYEMELVPWEAAAAGMKKKIATLAQRGECTRAAEIAFKQHLERKPILPKRRRILYKDITPQALVMQMSVGNPNAAMHSNEAGHLLNGRPMDDLPTLNTIWDAEKISTDRVDPRRAAEQPSPRLTISFQLQPRAFDKFCAREDVRDIGFLARALVCKPISTIGHRMLNPMDNSWASTELDRLNARVMQLLSIANNERSVVEFSDEAAQIWLRHFNEVEIEMRKSGRWSAIQDFASKMSENVARIAAIFEYVETGGVIIGRESILGAIQIMNWYCLQFDEFFGSGQQRRIEVEMARKLREWILCWSADNPWKFDIPVEVVYRYAPKCVRLKEDLIKALAHLSDFACLEKNSDHGMVLRFNRPPPAPREPYRWKMAPHPLGGH